MPKKYAREQKREALGLLSMYNNDVDFVHEITGIHVRTLRRWRAQMEGKKYRRKTRKNRQTDTEQPNSAPFEHNADTYALPEHNADITALSQTQDGHNDPDQGDPASNDVFEDFNYIRDQLMQLSRQLSAGFNPDDPDISRQALAIARLLDRILALDGILSAAPSTEQPQETIRFEYYYDDAPQKLPPWHGALTEERPISSVENYLPDSHSNYRPAATVNAIDDRDDDHSAAEEEIKI